MTLNRVLCFFVVGLQVVRPSQVHTTMRYRLYKLQVLHMKGKATQSNAVTVFSNTKQEYIVGKKGQGCCKLYSEREDAAKKAQKKTLQN